jgi:hypothetical protein
MILPIWIIVQQTITAKSARTQLVQYFNYIRFLDLTRSCLLTRSLQGLAPGNAKPPTTEPLSLARLAPQLQKRGPGSPMIRPAKSPFPGTRPGFSSALETNYVCVDNVRFWSMLAIIAVHSLMAWDVPSAAGLTQNLQITLLQTMKFGTIGFYFISGFLLGQWLDHYSAPVYFLRRFQRVGAPWALWAFLFALLPFTKRIMLPPLSVSDISVLASQLWHRVLDVLFFSPYWFVPNFLSALAFLLLCRRYLNDLRFGAALLSLSLLYGVNIHQHWVPASHTTALGGFVFYLWLGHWASRHESVVFGFLERVKAWQVVIAILLAGSIALAEAHSLRKHGSGNIVNTLRISNQVFSLLVVAGLMKVRRVTWPRFINVRASTFGLFLVHPVWGMVLCRLLDFGCAQRVGIRWESTLSHARLFGTGPWASLGLWTTTFMAYYGGSLVLTQALLAQPKLAWMVGQGASQKAGCEKRIQARPGVLVS